MANTLFYQSRFNWNFQNTYAIGDELVVEDLIPLNTSLNFNQIDNIKSVALNEPIIKNLLNFKRW